MRWALRLTIRPDGRDDSVERLPWGGRRRPSASSSGSRDGLTLAFSEPVPAAEASSRSPAPSSPPRGVAVVRRSSASPSVSVRRSNTVTTTSTTPRLPSRAGSSRSRSSLGTPEPPDRRPSCIAATGSSGWRKSHRRRGGRVLGPEPPAFNVLVRPETYKQIVVHSTGPASRGHRPRPFRRSPRRPMPADQVESCRRNFMVDAVLDAMQPGSTSM